MLQKPTKTMCQIATNFEEQLVSHMAPLLLEVLSKLTKASVTKLEEKALNYNEYQASWGIWGVLDYWLKVGIDEIPYFFPTLMYIFFR